MFTKKTNNVVWRNCPSAPQMAKKAFKRNGLDCPDNFNEYLEAFFWRLRTDASFDCYSQEACECQKEIEETANNLIREWIDTGKIEFPEKILVKGTIETINYGGSFINNCTDYDIMLGNSSDPHGCLLMKNMCEFSDDDFIPDKTKNAECFIGGFLAKDIDDKYASVLFGPFQHQIDKEYIFVKNDGNIEPKYLNSGMKPANV